MFDLGWQEVIIIIIIAVIIVGPKDLPKVFRAVKKITYFIRNLSIQVQSAFDDVVNETELKYAKKELDDFKEDINKIGTEAKKIEGAALQTKDLVKNSLTSKKVSTKKAKKVGQTKKSSVKIKSIKT